MACNLTGLVTESIFIFYYTQYIIYKKIVLYRMSIETKLCDFWVLHLQSRMYRINLANIHRIAKHETAKAKAKT